MKTAKVPVIITLEKIEVRPLHLEIKRDQRA
jgi:hypothetical protein